MRNPFYSEVFMACEAAARRLGLVLLCNSLGETELEKSSWGSFRNSEWMR